MSSSPILGSRARPPAPTPTIGARAARSRRRASSPCATSWCPSPAPSASTSADGPDRANGANRAPADTGTRVESVAGTVRRVRDPEVVRDGIAACRAVLGDHGLLLVQDGNL